MKSHSAKPPAKLDLAAARWHLMHQPRGRLTGTAWTSISRSSEAASIALLAQLVRIPT